MLLIRKRKNFSLPDLLSKNQTKYYSSLKLKKYREKEQKFLAEGVRTCEELLSSDSIPEILLTCPPLLTSARATKLIRRYQQAGITLAELDEKALNQISTTVHSQGVIAVVPRRTLDADTLLQSGVPTLLALQGLNDPGNLGTILRTAVWFGISGILLSTDSVEFTNPKVVRSSMGALFYTRIAETPDLRQTLLHCKENGYAIIISDTAGETGYRELKNFAKTVLVFGSESAGIDPRLREIATATVSIPARGRGESLNVAVAAGILMAEVTQQESTVA